MISAPPGLIAMYRKDDAARREGRDVLAFDGEGFALVLGDAGQLVRATSISGFLSVLEPNLEERIMSIAPGGGWRVEYASKDGAPRRSVPLVGWGVRPDGTVVPLDVDECGDVLVTEVRSDFVERIYHPDEESRPVPTAVT